MNEFVTIHSHYPARDFHAFFAHRRRTEYENPGQWARNMTDRAYFHSVRLWRVHFVDMNSGAENSNENRKKIDKCEKFRKMLTNIEKDDIVLT